MKITRDPRFEHVGNGGIYIGNMNRTRVWLDGNLVDPYDVIAADDEAGEVHKLVRDPNGFPLMEKPNEPKIEVLTGKVIINWPEQACTGCAENKRIERINKNWWML